MRRPRIGGYGTLPIVTQGSGYNTLTSPTDEEQTYAVAKRGGTEDLTLETIANDDVGAVRRIPVKLARAAAQTLYRFVFDFLKDNPTLAYDGTALFHTNHANTGTTALSDFQLKTAIQLMRNQAAYGDTAEVLGGANSPRWLVVPNELEDLSVRLTASATYVGATNEAGTTPNMIRLRYPQLEPLVIDYWTDPDNWYLVADPAKQPTIEIGFLNGQEEPELFIQDAPLLGSVFTADKITYKIRHIYGGNVLDHRMFFGAIV
jgi:phage major head subunit gpT-like protein